MALGIVMEHIAGVPLTRIFDDVVKDWTREEQIKLFTRLRRCVQVLNASHVSQKDWHANQVLCVDRDDAFGLDRADSKDLVLIDFAATDQPWAPCHSLPVKGDLDSFAARLGLDKDMLKAAGWLEREYYEY